MVAELPYGAGRRDADLLGWVIDCDSLGFERETIASLSVRFGEGAGASIMRLVQRDFLAITCDGRIVPVRDLDGKVLPNAPALIVSADRRNFDGPSETF